MEPKDDCTIEIHEDCVIVALDGVRSEVHGRDAVNGVKRAVAQQLLQAISQVPQIEAARREQALFEAQYGQQAVNRASQSVLAGSACGPADLARVIRRNNGY